MAKMLNLYLHYKGKNLDNIRQGRDLPKKFYIGKNKYLFWQILDENFPDRHLLVTQKGSDFVMKLSPGAKVSCNKDGSPVDSSYLNQNNILSGTDLMLRPDMTGTVAIAPNWEISYDFKEPWVTVLTPEEKQIAAQYARYSEPTSLERFNRNMILLFVFLTVVFLLIFDLAIKKSINYDVTLEDKVKTLQKAELVKAENLERRSTFEEQQDTYAGEETAQPQPQAQAQTGTATGTGTGTGKSAGEIFGNSFGKFDPNATASSAPTIKAVTTAEGFVTARPGRGGGGGGGGEGPGGSGPGSGGGYSTSFDPNAGRGFASDIGSVVTNAPRASGYSARPNAGVVEKATGDQSRLAPSGVAFGTTAKSTQTITSFRSKNVQQVSEGSIAEQPVEARTRYQAIGQTVDIYKGQIEALYTKWNAITPFTGSVSIRLLINSGGRVESAIPTPNGSIPVGFLSELKSLCEGWKFNVAQESDYSFTFRFRRKQ